MAYLSQCFLLNTKKAQQSHIQELHPIFLFDLHQGIVRNEHKYVTKMAKNTIMDVCGKISL